MMTVPPNGRVDTSPEVSLPASGSPEQMTSVRKLTASEMKHVFVVGCGRSGTTWIQLLLAQHAAVATSQETHLFKYVQDLERRWLREYEANILPWQPARRQTSTNPDRKVGLGIVLSEEEFYDLARNMVLRVFEKIASWRPNATLLVEKTPDHVYMWDTILRIFPGAYFLHVIRDPRAVVCSLRNVGQTWGKRWAPTTPAGAAELWCSAVATGRQIGRATSGYKEVRYEAMVADGPTQLQQIFDWLEIPADKSFCEQAVAACALENLQKASLGAASPWSLNEKPRNFYRRGAAEGWREELSSADLRIVEYVARSLMAELGYPPANGFSRCKPLRLLARQVCKAAEWRFNRRLEALLKNL